MKILLLPSTSPLVRLNRQFWRTWPRDAGTVKMRMRTMSGTYEMYANAIAKRKPSETRTRLSEEWPSELSFPALGLNESLVKALQSAFPDVEKPTAVQEKLIPEIMGRKDILLKDVPGSGKTFGLVLGLLNKPRMVIHDEKEGKKRVITTLFIVPHRDLAFQILRWIERVTKGMRPLGPPLPTIAQVLVRGGGEGETEKAIEGLRQTAPHILICTPQALMDVYEKEAGVLRLETLSTVVVDEVDYLVEIDRRKVAKHGGTTREILNVIYGKRQELARMEERAEDAREREEGMPQLIVSSATLRVQLRDYLFAESGWVNLHNVVKIKGETGQKGKTLHSVLVVKEDGRVVNAEGAVMAERPVEEAAEETEEDEDEDGEAITRSYFHQKYGQTPSPFDAHAVEAIATAFALDVPRIALLVIPSSAPVRRIVYELRQLGVSADALDLLVERCGAGYLAQASGQRVCANPRLLVGTAATIRGLDLAALSHVFLLGLPEGRAVEGYTHIAGRVGRFGRGGRAISIVSEGESVRMRRVLNAIGETVVLFEHFD